MCGRRRQRGHYLRGRCKHLIVDGVEEDNPASHFVCKRVAAKLRIGADHLRPRRRLSPFSGGGSGQRAACESNCELKATLDETFVMEESVAALGAGLGRSWSDRQRGKGC